MTMGDKPAYPVYDNGAGEGCSAPLRSPGKTPLRQLFAVTKFARFRGCERPLGGQSARRRPRPPATVRRGRPVSRLSPRRDRRAAWSASPPLRRRSPRPPGRTPPVPPPGSNPLPNPARLGRAQRFDAPGTRARRQGIRGSLAKGAPPPFEPPASRASATAPTENRRSRATALPRGIALGAKRHDGLAPCTASGSRRYGSAALIGNVKLATTTVCTSVSGSMTTPAMKESPKNGGGSARSGAGTTRVPTKLPSYSSTS